MKKRVLSKIYIILTIVLSGMLYNRAFAEEQLPDAYVENFINNLQNDSTEGIFWSSPLYEYEGKLYYCNLREQYVEVMDLDGNNRSVFIDYSMTKEYYPKRILLTEEYCYVECGSYTIRQYTLDGKQVGEIHEISGQNDKWWFKDGYLYFQDMFTDQTADGGLFKVSTKTNSMVKQITDFCSYKADIYFYEDYIYYFDDNDNYCRIRDDGTGDEFLEYDYSGGIQNKPMWYAAHDGDMMYYYKPGDTIRDNAYYARNIQTQEEEKLTLDITPVEGEEMPQELTSQGVCIDNLLIYVKCPRYLHVYGEIWAYNLDTGEDRLLHKPECDLFHGDCIVLNVPGATRIYYQSDESGGKQIYSMDLEGNSKVLLQEIDIEAERVADHELE